jgi:hypothetical protein
MRTTISKLLSPLLGQPVPKLHLGKWNPHGTMTDINKRIDMANMDNCYVDMNSVLKYSIQDEIAAESDKMKYNPNKQ